MPERMSKKQPCKRDMAGVDRVLDPRKRHEVGEREAHRLVLANVLAHARGGACMARCRAGSAMRTHWPTKSEASTGAPSSSALMPPHMAWPSTTISRTCKRPHRELDGRADAVRLVVGAVRRDDVGDVADDEELAGPGIEHHLRVGTAVRAGDDQRARTLAEAAQRFEASALGLPGAGTEAAIAFDQVVHGEPNFYFSRGSFPRAITLSKKDASPHGRTCRLQHHRRAQRRRTALCAIRQELATSSPSPGARHRCWSSASRAATLRTLWC